MITTKITIIFSIIIVGLVSACKPKVKSSVREWPFADVSATVGYKRVTKISPEGQTLTGISFNTVNFKKVAEFALVYHRGIAQRFTLEATNNAIIWLREEGVYIPFRGELAPGASIQIGTINGLPILLHFVHRDGEGMRSMYMESVAGQTQHKPIEQSQLDKLTDDDIEKLVVSLRSKNLDPTDFYDYTGIPTNYDLEVQKQVWWAENQLRHLGLRAFPSLIRHINDDDYCQTIEWSRLLSHTVGEVCGWIIEDQVNIAGAPHRFIDRKSQKGMWGAKYFTAYHKNYMAEWWEANKNRRLEEMQLESVEWVIAKEKELGFTNPEQKKAVLEKLEGIRQKLLITLQK